MINYINLKNHQINRRVAIALGCHVRKSAFDTNYYYTDDDKPWNKCAPHGPVEDFIPCEDWADAGPIIQEYGIGIMPFKNIDAQAWDTSQGLLASKKVSHENPLRAAMIVFLMMQEVK